MSHELENLIVLAMFVWISFLLERIYRLLQDIRYKLDADSSDIRGTIHDIRRTMNEMLKEVQRAPRS